VNLFSMVSAVGEWWEANGANITLDADRCLHAQAKAATCQRCVSACPVNALMLADNNSIMLKDEACVQCGLCVHVCPVGAFRGEDSLPDLLTVVTRLPQQHRVELACAVHPAPEIGPIQSQAVLQTRGCLAALGPADFLSLFAIGIEHLVLRLEACATCPLGQTRAEIENRVTLASQIAAGPDQAAQKVTIINQPHKDWAQRPVTSLNQPRQSRRDFFKSFSMVETQQDIIRELAADEPPAATKNRRRLLTAWRMLPAAIPLVISPELANGLSLAKFTADPTCTACHVCDRICPTGALRLEIDDQDNYQLTFAAGQCVDCGLCLDLCEPKALHRHLPATAADLLAEKPVVLQQGRLQRCRRCSAGFVAPATSNLCPVCEFRQKHPFGNRFITSSKHLANQDQP